MLAFGQAQPGAHSGGGKAVPLQYDPRLQGEHTIGASAEAEEMNGKSQSLAGESGQDGRRASCEDG